jgi:hypothetical protein
MVLCNFFYVVLNGFALCLNFCNSVLIYEINWFDLLEYVIGFIFLAFFFNMDL